MRLIAIAIALSLFTGCSTPTVCGFREEKLVEWFIPASGGANRGPVPCDRVAFLDAAPTNREYVVIGWVAPATGVFKSWGEAINASRAAASLHGADAIYLIDQKEIDDSGWAFSMSNGFAGGHGGKHHSVQFTVKAIAWKDVGQQ
jgi:hypothetical protein